MEPDLTPAFRASGGLTKGGQSGAKLDPHVPGQWWPEEGGTRWSQAPPRTPKAPPNHVFTININFVSSLLHSPNEPNVFLSLKSNYKMPYSNFAVLVETSPL